MTPPAAASSATARSTHDRGSHAQHDHLPRPNLPRAGQIVDRWTWESTSGPVEHVKTSCERGHWFTPTVDLLDPRPAPTAAEPSPMPVLVD